MIGPQINVASTPDGGLVHIPTEIAGIASECADSLIFVMDRTMMMHHPLCQMTGPQLMPKIVTAAARSPATMPNPIATCSSSEKFKCHRLHRLPFDELAAPGAHPIPEGDEGSHRPRWHTL